MSNFKSMYTELLAAAIKAADEAQLTYTDEWDKQQWKLAKRSWKKELYYGRGGIAPIGNKKLDKNVDG